ncbi:hypothetical protein MKW98_003272 [Papaver atlanticum]|uniref:Uncharacterized protein n=1 Tax=Papaver atlanticum TaxID=357466 RepID=A0AAD4XTJ6_9MAGN|nr:hypothetical protein MKW98_003272 [Papaver atlanticum]
MYLQKHILLKAKTFSKYSGNGTNDAPVLHEADTRLGMVSLQAQREYTLPELFNLKEWTSPPYKTLTFSHFVLMEDMVPNAMAQDVIGVLGVFTCTTNIQTMKKDDGKQLKMLELTILLNAIFIIKKKSSTLEIPFWRFSVFLTSMFLVICQKVAHTIWHRYPCSIDFYRLCNGIEK